jgi:hypothetical protein
MDNTGGRIRPNGAGRELTGGATLPGYTIRTGSKPGMPGEPHANIAKKSLYYRADEEDSADGLDRPPPRVRAIIAVMT